MSQETTPLLATQKGEYQRQEAGASATDNSDVITAKLNKVDTAFGSFWPPKKLYVVIAALILFGVGVLVVASHGKDHPSHNWAQQSWKELEQRVRLSSKWSKSRVIEDDEEISLSLAVKQQNVDTMVELLRDVSDPRSKNFGEFLSFEEVHDLVAPNEKTLNAIYNWLSYHGVDEENIKEATPSGDFIRLTVPVSTANKMFNTEYWKWKHEDGREAVRVSEHYHVPSGLIDHLDFVSPSIRFPFKSQLKSIEAIDESLLSKGDEVGAFESDYYVYPDKLYNLYKVDSDTTVSKETTQCVASFLGEWYDDTDLSTFWEFFDVEETTVTRMPSYQPDGYGSEAELDVQYMTSLGQGIDTMVWDIEDDNYFLTLLEQIQDLDIVPNVVSMSYGGDEQSNGIEYCGRGDLEFAKVSLMGCTFFASAGDDGAVSSDGSCDESGMFTPSFPASSRFVTAVGGVYGGTVSDDSDECTGELAWYNSGGGFSVFFEAETFENKAQSTYMDTASSLPPLYRFNAANRGYPDVAAQSVAYIICYEEGLYAVSGTSCSSPTIAGMFSLIINLRVQNGLSPMGWLNPTLYALGDLDHNYYFNDVIEGYNEGSEEDNSIAFFAAAGWDPITGWGTPKWDRLRDALLDLEGTFSTNSDSDTKNSKSKKQTNIRSHEY